MVYSYSSNVFKVPRGDSFSHTFNVYESDGTTAFDLSAYDVKFTVRSLTSVSGSTDTDVLFQLTEGNGITISGANNNQVTIVPTNVQTTSTGNYVYDLQAVNGTTTHTLSIGLFNITYDVTKLTS